jgi:hypothetical protein
MTMTGVLEVAEGGFVLMTSDGPRWNFRQTPLFTLLPRGGVATAHSSAYRVEVTPSRGARHVIERGAAELPIHPLNGSVTGPAASR